MITCINIQNFVEGENCASTILVGHLEPLFHTLGSDMNLFGSNMILFGSIFKLQELSVMLVAALINFGVKNQVQQVCFKIVAGDLISFLTFVSDLNLFGSYLILFGSFFKFQEPSFMLVAGLINFGVINQVPQVSFKTDAGDLISFHTFGSDMNLFGFDMILFACDMILFGSSFKFQEPSVVAGLMNFGATNQVP